VCQWDTIDWQVQSRFGYAGKGMACCGLMGAGVFMSTVGLVLVGHHWCMLLGRQLQVLEVYLATAMHKVSWDVAFGHVQTTEVVAKGSRFGVVKDQLVHCHWVI